MKQNIKKLRIITCCIFITLLSGYAGCRSTQQEKLPHDGQFTQRRSGDNDTLMTLIPDYSGMKEDNAVAAVWTEEGFGLGQCRQIKVYPVLNYSQVDYPWVQKKLETQLQEIFQVRKGAERASIEAGVLAAVVALKPKTELLKRFSPSFDDIPSLTVELIIIDEATKKPLCKICHSGKDKEFSKALDNLLRDLQLFVSKKL